jgi:hypothetical protein
MIALRIALIYVGLIVAWYFAREILWPGYAPDFVTLWTAVRAPPDLVYDAQALTAAQAHLAPVYNLRPFPYPPTVLLPLLPFGALPLWPAMAAWTLTGAGLFAWSLRGRLAGWELALTALAPSVLFAAASGQTTLLLGAAIVWAVFALPTRPRLAGAVLGLVAAMKPQLVLLAPLALLFQPAALVAFIGSGAAMCALSAAVYGLGVWKAWLAALPGFVQIVAATPHVVDRNLSPAGALAALGAEPVWLLRLAWAAVGVALVVIEFRRDPRSERRLAALVLGSFLCSPYVMPYDAAVLAPAAVIMLRRPFLPAALALLILPYIPWIGAAATAALALALLGDGLWQEGRRSAPAAA